MCSIENLLTSPELLSDGHQRVKGKEAVRNPPGGGPPRQNSSMNLTWR